MALKEKAHGLHYQAHATRRGGDQGPIRTISETVARVSEIATGKRFPDTASEMVLPFEREAHHG